MITLEDCIAFCGLTEQEVLAIAEHEHIPEVAAAALAEYLLNRPKGAGQIRNMICEEIRAAPRIPRQRDRIDNAVSIRPQGFGCGTVIDEVYSRRIKATQRSRENGQLVRGPHDETNAKRTRRRRTLRTECSKGENQDFAENSAQLSGHFVSQAVDFSQDFLV